MLKKTVTLLTLFFLLQLLVSCFDDCNCPKQQNREATFIELNSRAELVSTQEDSLIQLSEFLIYLRLEGSEEIQAVNNFKLEALGFNKAWACDCVPPNYSFLNSVDSINIFLFTSNGPAVEIAESFQYINGDYTQPINDYFQQQEDPFQYYQLSLEVPLKLKASRLATLPETFKLEIKLFHDGENILSDELNVDLKAP